MTSTQERPANSAGALSAGLVLQQRERDDALRSLARLRKEASAEIARLLAFLDASDPYVMSELEDDDDREQECEDEGAQCEDEGAISDDEPSLGSLDCHSPEIQSQERWSAGGRRDLEQDDAESGIGDQDGLLEQIGTQDWQNGGMV